MPTYNQRDVIVVTRIAIKGRIGDNAAVSFFMKPSFCSVRVGAMTVCLALVSLVGASGVAQAQSFSNPATITLPDSGGGVRPATPYPAPITVTGVSGNVTDVNVTLGGFSHSFPDDVSTLR